MKWENAEDIKQRLEQILCVLDLPHINLNRVFCYRTYGSKSRAFARTWAFPKVFQHALDVEAAYVIEVVSQYFDKLDEEKKTRVLIHELLHIPKNFSGALLPHKTGQQNISQAVSMLYKEYKRQTNEK